MKALLISFLIVIVAAGGRGLRFSGFKDSNTVDDFLTGLLFGVGDYNYYSDLVACAGSNWNSDLVMIRGYFQQLDESTQTTLSSRLDAVADVWDYLASKYADCSSGYPSLKAVFDAVEYFDLTSGVIHFQQEAPTFHSYLQTATSNYDGDSYMSFGMYTGMFYKKLLTA
mgnify:CR=1 FL=1